MFVNIIFVLVYCVKIMGNVLSLVLVIFVIVLLDGWGKIVKSKIIVCLIFVLIMVYV